MATETRGAKVERKCKTCKGLFTARVADVKRGWALYCSKACKAIKQEQKTGQFKAYLQGGAEYADEERLCFPSPADDDIQPDVRFT